MNLHIAPASEARNVELPVAGLRLRSAAHEQLLHAAEHLATEGEARHAGIHQARKSIRRARAILALGMHGSDRRAKRLDADLGRLCRGMSRLRDGQALLEALHRLDASAPDEVRAILPDAEAAARHRRDQLLSQALARDPDFRSRRQRLLALSNRLMQLDWQAVGIAEIADAIRRSERRVEKAERRARRHPDRDQDWHVFRRRLRRLRQQDSVLARLQPELRPGMKDLEDRAGVLGEAQDDTLLLSQCGRASPFPSEQRALLRRVSRQRLAHARH
jgi:hypothetical protein